MPKINIGLSKKIGLPDYGSLGASCHVEIDWPGSLADQEEFQRQVRAAYLACGKAVNDELARQRGDGSQQQVSQSGGTGNGHTAGSNGNSGNGSHRATPKQLEYIQQLARQIRGLGTRRLDDLAGRMFGKPLADLTSLDASGLIDTLKAIKAGSVNLDDALNGAPQ
jgi:hypothetical protein